MSADNESDDDGDLETMVITLGSRMIKAAYAGEKTCRYLSQQVHVLTTTDSTLIEQVHVLTSTDSTLIEPDEGKSIPLLDTTEEKVNQKQALVTALRKCWSEQYGINLQPTETRLALVVPTRSSTLLNEIADLVFSELKVLSLCVMTPGEAVGLIDDGENSVVVDIGYRETRVETFVGWQLVDRIIVVRGGCDVVKLSGGTDPREVIFSADCHSRSIPDIVRSLLEKYDKISRVIAVGSTSYKLDSQYFEDKCGVSYTNSRSIKYHLPPERNKSAWLGASIAGGIPQCKHRFYTAGEWNEKGTIYTPLIKS
ncbi:uncharacterized protein LOC134826563 [Bolinopsis microptera]|uniref:uncharacterized protein LOC134826563 n=1 Tax=Bolinopsis microptera TaxID=2820187 RepID=UPI0030790FB2